LGFFSNMKKVMTGQQVEGGIGMAGRTVSTGAPSAGNELGAQAHEQNRILTVGSPGQALIKGHVDTGENVAGNPIWIFDLEVTPEGGAPYAVQKREIVSSAAMGSYPDGAQLACRIDPADPQKIAFGEKPFM
jgi:hypothetical protein